MSQIIENEDSPDIEAHHVEIKKNKNVWEYIVNQDLSEARKKLADDKDDSSKQTKEKSNSPANGILNGEYFHYLVGDTA